MAKNNDERIIIMPHGEVGKLCKDFKTNNMTIWRALRAKRKTPQAKMLRAAALQRGGKFLED